MIHLLINKYETDSENIQYQKERRKLLDRSKIGIVIAMHHLPSLLSSQDKNPNEIV